MQLIFYAEDVRDAAYDGPLDQPPREQVERTEAALHRLLEDALGADTERRSIGAAAEKAAQHWEKAYQAQGALLGLLWASRPSKRSSTGSRRPT